MSLTNCNILRYYGNLFIQENNGWEKINPQTKTLIWFSAKFFQQLDLVHSTISMLKPNLTLDSRERINSVYRMIIELEGPTDQRQQVNLELIYVVVSDTEKTEFK